MIAAFAQATCWRLVATRNPGADVFQGITDDGEREERYEIESLTNERLRAPFGNLVSVPKGLRAYGPDLSRYGPAQAFGAQIRAGGGNGIVYASVRRPGGMCVAGFRPGRFSDCRHARLIQCHWDGARLTGPDGSFA